MPDIRSIRTALASSLDTLVDDNGDLVTTSAWMQANPPLPSIEVTGLERIGYDDSYQRGADSMTFLVQGFASAAENITGQRTLARWCDTGSTVSVKHLIEADTTLGGVVDHVRVIEYTGDKKFPHPSLVEVVGGEWRVEVDVSQ